MPAKKMSFSDKEMIPILKKEFIEGSSSPADLYLRLGPGNYVMVAHEGEKTNFSELHLATKEDIEFLYICSSEYKKCVGQKLTIAGILVQQKNMSLEKKTIFISQGLESVFTEIEALGFSHESLEHARTISVQMQGLVAAKPDLLSMMNAMNEVPGDLLRHSLAVSAVSVLIAKGMGWTLPATLEKVALAGLLHDLGMKELPPEILEKPRHELNYEEQLVYETHAFRGAEILRSMPSVSEDLLTVVIEHHENAIGQGYPRRLRDYKLNPLSRVVALADCFCEVSLKHINNPHPKSGVDAVNYIEVSLGQPFSKAVFQALKDEVLREK